MKLTNRERLILSGAVRDLATYRTAVPPAHGGTMTLTERQLDDAIYNAQRRVVDCRPAHWLGRERLLPSDRVANSRAYASLQAKGLVVRVTAKGNYGQAFKTYALGITPEGESLANQITEPVETGSTPVAACCDTFLERGIE